MTAAFIQAQRETLAQLSKTQLERLSFIDFRLYFLGDLRRADVANRFGTGPAAATRDIALYKEIAPDNLVLQADKVYRWTPAFTPLFDGALYQMRTPRRRFYADIRCLRFRW